MKRPPFRSRARGLSLLEVLVGVFIIGVSALPILELIRSGTASLEVNQIDAAARRLASDVLERLSAPSYGKDRVGTALRKLLRSPVAWRDFVDADPSLAYGFPTAPGSPLARLFDMAEVRIALEEQKPYTGGGVTAAIQLTAYAVTVSWTDRSEHRKSVRLARLVDG